MPFPIYTAILAFPYATQYGLRRRGGIATPAPRCQHPTHNASNRKFYQNLRGLSKGEAVSQPLPSRTTSSSHAKRKGFRFPLAFRIFNAKYAKCTQGTQRFYKATSGFIRLRLGSHTHQNLCDLCEVSALFALKSFRDIWRK